MHIHLPSLSIIREIVNLCLLFFPFPWNSSWLMSYHVSNSHLLFHTQLLWCYRWDSANPFLLSAGPMLGSAIRGRCMATGSRKRESAFPFASNSFQNHATAAFSPWQWQLISRERLALAFILSLTLSDPALAS